ncbi:MAG TPA: glycosyltransferase family 4 protein [Solirubrobacteraceae bacterium]|nr:glycosyltransferase family 4 protein [Solirubrobacteraceae bacterium]
MSSELRLAYITTQYPGVSHTFILREVTALRRLGADVHTISLRRTSAEHLLSQENRDAAETTYAIRPPRLRDVLGAHLSALGLHPRAYLATLREALALARPGLRGRLWQIFYFAEAIMVWRYCAGSRVSHLHAHHGSPPADVALLAAHFGKAAGSGPGTWSLTMHGPIEFSDVRWFRLPQKLERADAVICISEFARSQLMALVDDRHWSKLRVVHCGVGSSEYRHLGEPPHERPRVLCVGRLVAEKGQAILLDAVAQLAREAQQVEAVLVGSGPMRTRLEQLALELGVSDRVVFRGALGQEQVRDCYADATLVCSASFAEGVPVVLMEAMASGRAVIATAISGVRELVRDGDTGLLVTPGRADELAGAISVLVQDTQLRLRLASSGRERVLREFDVDRSAAQLAAIFSEILHPSERPLEARAAALDPPAIEAVASAR